MAVPSVCLLPQRPGGFAARPFIIHYRTGAAYAHAFLVTATAALALALAALTLATLTLAALTLAATLTGFLGTALSNSSSSSSSSFFDTPLV